MFQFKDRGFKETICLVPGWAIKGDIFFQFDIPYNYLILDHLNQDDFCTILNEELKHRYLDKIHLLGFSMGGYFVVDYANSFPEKVDRVLLQSVRPFYPKKYILGIKRLLRRSKEDFLIKFYLQFFLDEHDFLLFKRYCFDRYLQDFSIHYLNDQLDILAECKLDYNMIQTINKCVFLHGIHDQIAPLGELQSFLGNMSSQSLKLFDNSHFFHDFT